MIVKLRPVTGGDFEVDIDADDTIETLKAIIISTHPELGEDPDDLKLVYKGKLLANGDQTLEAIGFKENEFMALMAKKKPAAAAAAPAAPAAATPTPSPAPAVAPVPAPAPALQAAGGGGLMGAPPEGVVAELCSMGFPRDLVLRALQSAFNNPERAAEYLLEGNIPPPPDAAGVPPQAGAGQAQGVGGSWPGGMLGPQLLTKSGPQPTAQALGSPEVVLIYFSAHWCPPCQRFTPMLARGYSSLPSGQQTVQVVFASSDRSPQQFEEYYGQMPWLALPFGGQQAQMLGGMFGVQGIPSLVALDGRTGQVLTTSARDVVVQNNFDLLAACRAWGKGTAPMPQPVAPPTPVTPAAPPKRPEPAEVEIDKAAAEAALAKVAALELDSQVTFFETILKVLNNILQNPEEAKFRSLKKGNAALQSKLFSHGDNAATELLLLAGFEDTAETIALPGPPDGRCTAVRNALQSPGEAAAMNKLRKERDAKIAEEVEKDKNRPPERSFGGDEKGRHNIGSSRKPRGGG
mmetsp:Transcript_100291/g.251440  ORF Transcript_100291/g.251440 Transcript_100291/m.251440 type:complete len:520 (+) Transcript_100291:195-1754(+)